MDTARYYTMLLEGARAKHRALMKEQHKWNGFLKDAVRREAREWRIAASKYIKHIREARDAH